jgi:thiamine transport system permease protein
VRTAKGKKAALRPLHKDLFGRMRCRNCPQNPHLHLSKLWFFGQFLLASTSKIPLCRGLALILLTAFALFVMTAMLTVVFSAVNTDFFSILETIKPMLVFTLWQAALSTLFSILCALILALAVENTRRKKLILMLFSIPLSLPALVAIMGVLALLGRNGFFVRALHSIGVEWQPSIYGLSGIILVHVFFNMPLALRIITHHFQNIAVEQLKLASSLGLSAKDRFFILQWPVFLSVLPSLISLIFLLCVSSYTIILVLGGGPRAVNLQVGIYQALSFDFDLARVAVLTCVQIAIGLSLIGLLPHVRLVSARSMARDHFFYFKMSVLHRFFNFLIIALGVGFILLPLIAIFLTGLNVHHFTILTDPLFWRALFTSFMIGTISAVFSVISAWILSRASYFCTHKIGCKILRAAPFLMLAFPPIVLGVGWFIFMIKMNIPLDLAPLLIITVNSMMALPFALQTIAPKLHETYAHYERLAQSLNITGLARLTLIDFPLMRQTLKTAFLLSFAISLGDLGVVTLFGADHILTLPLLIFQKMGSYRSNDAFGLALYLAMITLIIAYLSREKTHDNAL